MLKFSNLSIRKKIIFVFSFQIILLALVLFLQVYKTGQLADSITGRLLENKLKGDLNAAEEYLFKHFGEIKLSDAGRLTDSAGVPIDGRFEMVDDMRKDLEIVSTVFVKDGSDYRRVITSITRENGERIVGTLLGKDSAAYPSLREGKQFIGDAAILGAPYLTGYRPVFDGNKNVIGVLFIGIQKQAIHDFVRENTFSNIMTMSFFVLLLGVFYIIIAIVLGRSITRPINNMLSYTKVIEAGNLVPDRKFTDAQRSDEVGILMDSLQKMSDKFRSVVISIQNSSDRIAESSVEMSRTTETFSVNAQTQAETA
ncbi:MAG: Cache 3/Cache 2 fusion domain-containing protein, partial [Spirochaetota bacterium]